MPSRMVTQRQKSATDVGTAINNHAELAQEALAGVFGPFLADGETVPDLVLLQSLCGRILEQSREKIVISDEAHLAELRDDSAPRKRRDAAAAALAERLTKLRDGLQGLLGSDAAASFLGIDGAMKREPVILVRKARRALGILQSESLELPRSQLPGVVVDPRPWAESLEDPLRELEAAMAAVANERRKAECTLIAKQEAMEEYDRTFLQIAQLQECLFRFAGLHRLADRVRPSKRRPGRTEIEAESSSAEAPAAEAPVVTASDLVTPADPAE